MWSQPYEGFLVRNVDNETFGTRKDDVSQSALTLELDELKKRAQKMKAGATFVYHLAEGSSPKLLDEYKDVADAGCLQERLVASQLSLGLRELNFKRAFIDFGEQIALLNELALTKRNMHELAVNYHHAGKLEPLSEVAK